MQLYECSPQEPVKDQLLALTFDIYVNEQRAWNKNHWKPLDPEIFDVNFKVNKVHLTRIVDAPESVMAATFEIDDCRVTVEQEADAALYEDNFTRELLGKLQESYYSHPHWLCLRALRQKIITDRVRSSRIIRNSDKKMPRYAASMLW